MSTDSFDAWRKDRREADIRAVQGFGLDNGQAILDLIFHISPQTYFETYVLTLLSLQ